MKILLLGSKGMLGSQFGKKLKDFDLRAFGGHDELDITSMRSVTRVFEGFVPDIVINCAAYTNVDEAEFIQGKKDSLSVNRDGVKNLAKCCNKFGSILLHFSTDYVFDGRKDGYDENAICNPLNSYGESKLQGEIAIEKEMEKYFIVRTSWLYGPNGKNFVNTMLRLGVNGEIKVVDDQIGCPTYTSDLAESVIENFIKNPGKDFGIYHLTNDGAVSWNGFAREIFSIKGMKVTVHKISTKEFPRPAQRPMNSVLLNTKLPKMRKWEEALKKYLDQKK